MILTIWSYAKHLLLAALCASSLHGEERATHYIELIANFPVGPDGLNHALIKHHLPLEVCIGDLRNYGQALQKNRSWFSHYLRKFSLDFPLKITPRSNIAKIVFYNFDPSYYKRFQVHKLPKDKLILFMWEPPCVIKKMYSDTTASWFSKIYTWNDDLVNNTTHFKFYYPVLKQMINPLPDFEEKKLCTLVCSNLTSKHPNELYSERKKAIAFFEAYAPDEFEFYGRKWEEKEHPCYRGAPTDKLETIKQYRFSICYENSTGIKGYITEKIFDCFAAGSIPIYWGATNISDYIPKNCYIDRRDFTSIEEVYAFIKTINKTDYTNYLMHIRHFLESEEAKKFSMDYFEKIFCEAVQ